MLFVKVPAWSAVWYIYIYICVCVMCVYVCVLKDFYKWDLSFLGHKDGNNFFHAFTVI